MSNASPSNTKRPAFIEAQYAFAAHIRDPVHAPRPGDVEERRMAIYRELFFNNVEGFLSNTFPVLRALMCEQDWQAMARDFFAHHQCHTPLFLEIPREFLHYLEQERTEQPNDPPFLYELAHYEWVELALSVAEAPDWTPDINTSADLSDSTIQVSPLAWALEYTFPVHHIRPEVQPQEPSPQMNHLLVYRDLEDEVGFLELNPVSARLFSLLSSSPHTGKTAMEQISEELQHPNPNTVLTGGLEVLSQWQARGIVSALNQE